MLSAYTTSKLILTSLNSGTSNADNFLGCNGTDKINTTESAISWPLPFAGSLKRFMVIVSANTKNAATTFAFRNAGTDATGTTFTNNAGVVETFDSGPLSIPIADLALINFKAFTALSGSGSIAYRIVALISDG